MQVVLYENGFAGTQTWDDQHDEDYIMRFIAEPCDEPKELDFNPTQVGSIGCFNNLDEPKWFRVVEILPKYPME